MKLLKRIAAFILSLWSTCCLAAWDANGSNSLCSNASANLLNGSTAFTFCAWVYIDGRGGNNSGRIFVMDEGEADPGYIFLFTTTDITTLALGKSFSGTNGQWTIDVDTWQTAWTPICVSYDFSSTANDPVFRTNYTAETIEGEISPTASSEAPAAGYTLANRSDGLRSWDGGLKYIQFWNVILTADEMDQAMRNPGSVKRGLMLYQRNTQNTDGSDYSGNAFNCTPSNMGTRANDPGVALPVIGGGMIIGH